MKENDGDALQRSNSVSEELFIRASAMYLAPASLMLLPTGGNEHRRS